MPKSNSYRPGRHFLQIPGPSNVPERVLRAIDRAIIDHRGPEFADMARSILARIRPIFGTENPVVIFPSSGTGAWEAALVNTLSPGDRVLMFETGHFAALWSRLAGNLGLDVDWVTGDWRRGVDPAIVEEKLAADKDGAIKAVMAVHNETSTGATSDIAAIRAAIDRAGHPALLMVDTISSLASMDYRHDEWGVDVAVGGSQKGLMLPPGLGFNAIGDKAIAAMSSAKLTRSYWDWRPQLDGIAGGAFPYTPATNLLYGLDEALTMFDEEGLENVFARHERFAEATRRAVQGWGLELCCLDPAAYSNTLTAIMMPDGIDADAVRKIILDRFDMSLGTGLGKMQGKLFRIGHVGDLNDLTLAGVLCGVEMGLGLAGVPHRKGGVDAALGWLADAESSA
jgi:alanine-glyoxylate transaminase / serine-glyoxylate transaminase / serine-pyruvate transaminase